MPSKTSEKKSSGKSKKSDQGCVGVVFSGLLKPRVCKLFHSDSTDLNDTWEEEKKVYGSWARIKYVKCEDSDKVYAKVAKIYDKQNEIEDLYVCNASNMIDTIKQESGLENPIAHGLGKPKPKTSKKDDSDEKKTKKNTKKTEDDEENDEKPKKTMKGSKSSKKVESDDENEEDQSEEDEENESEDEKPKKISKGNKTKEEKPKKSNKTK